MDAFILNGVRFRWENTQHKRDRAMKEGDENNIEEKNKKIHLAYR